MNRNQLHLALSHHDPDPHAVLHQLKAKRHRRHRRQSIIGAFAIVALAATGAGIWSQAGTSSKAPNSALTPGKIIATNSYEPPTATGFDGCESLQTRFSDPLALGASVITGTGTRTGKTGLDGYRYHEVVLTNIKTLAGPHVENGATAWIQVPEVTGPKNTSEPAAITGFGAPSGPLWGPDNSFFGLYLPQKVNKGPLGTILQQLPLVGDKVIFKPAGCWNSFTIGNLTGTPYHGPLTEVPGSGAYADLAPRGFVALPLTSIEAFLPK